MGVYIFKYHSKKHITECFLRTGFLSSVTLKQLDEVISLALPYEEKLVRLHGK